jgi:peroxiredoxin
MRVTIQRALSVAVLLLCAQPTRGADERAAFQEGWKTAVAMPGHLWGPEGRYVIWVEDGWLQVRRETNDGQTDWHVVLARATDPTAPVVKAPRMPPEGNPRFEVNYRDGRYFVREDLNALRVLREPKPAEEPSWPAIPVPAEQRARMGWGKSKGPPPIVMFEGPVDDWHLYASGPDDHRLDCWLRLTPTALSKDGHGVSVSASGLIQTFAGDNRVLDDGALLVAQRSSEAEAKAKVVANLAIGAKAPPLAAKTLEGKPLSLEDYRGKYVLLDFWATWCGPCVAEMPKMQDVQAAFGPDDRFVIIGLSLDREVKAAQSFVKDRGLAWVQAFVGDEAGEKVLADYGVSSIPVTFLIGPDGRVIARGMRGDVIKDAVKKALATP